MHQFHVRWQLLLPFFVLTSLTLPHEIQAHEVGREMVRAANVFLKSLDNEQRAAVEFEFDDSLRRDWQFIPMERKGLGIKSMRPDQRGLAMSLVQSALSHRGFATATQIMALEQVLAAMENNPVRRDPTKYHLFLFGKPAEDGSWGWRIEGHHLSVSVTVIDGKNVAISPSFLGSNPAEVRQGPMQGLRVLGDLEDQARELVKQLSAEQKEQAVVGGDAPKDIINGPGKSAERLEPIGINAADLSAEQQAKLQAIAKAYLGHYRSELADQEWAKVEQAGLDKLTFAWIGKIKRGQAHYFRIQGPTFVMEYDNTQNQANHAHLVWRDLENDFGDALLEHYQQQHKSASGN